MSDAAPSAERRAASTSANVAWPTWWGERVRQPGSAMHLALVRVVLALHCLTVFLSPAVPLLRTLRGEPQPLTHTVIPAALERWLAAHAVEPLMTAGLVLSLLVLVGLATRVALWALLACFLVTQNYWYRSANFHDDWLYATVFLLVLALAPCADALSLDALIARRRGKPDIARAANAHRWPIEAMIAWLAVTYGAAGLAKLLPLRKGALWLTGASSQRFAIEFLHDSPIYWVRGESLFDYAHNRWVFAVASFGTVAVELSALALLASRRAYAPVAMALLGMHASIYCFGIPGFVQIFVASCALLLPPERFPDYGAALTRPAASPPDAA